MDTKRIFNIVILLVLLALLMPSVMATSSTVVTNSIIGKTPLGLLIDLHLTDFFDADTAIMYYNYIALFGVVMWAAFASQTNESRFAFTTPWMAGFFVFIGWLNAGTHAADYWGTIILCLVLGAFMYLNDMNHEKYGIAGPGDKLFAVAFMVLCFSASIGFITSSQFTAFGTADTMQMENATQNSMCNTAYTCDSNGNVALGVSVSQVSSAGGVGSNLVSDLFVLGTIAVAMLKMAIIVLGSILFVSVVILAAYPALAASPLVVIFLGVMNLVIWAIYFTAFFRWYYKPGVGEGQI